MHECQCTASLGEDFDAGVQCQLAEECGGRRRRCGSSFADKRARKDLRDADINVAANCRNGIAGEVDGFVLRRAARDLTAVVGSVLDHDFERLVEMTSVVGALNFALAGVEDGEAFDLDLFGD